MAKIITEMELDTVVHIGPLRKSLRWLTAKDCIKISEVRGGDADYLRLSEILTGFDNFEAAYRAGAL